jgi:hypothetical protein
MSKPDLCTSDSKKNEGRPKSKSKRMKREEEEEDDECYQEPAR